MLRPSGSSPRAGATLPGKAWEWTCLHGLSSQPRATYVIPRSAELEPALNWPVWSPFCHRRSRGTRHAAHPHHGERKWHARALRQPAAHGEDARKATAAAGARRGPRRHPRRRGRGRARRPRRARRGGAAGPPPAPRPRRGAGARSGTRGENAAAPRRRRRDGDGGARRRGPRGGPAGERAGGRGGHDPGLPRGELPGGPRRVPARPQRVRVPERGRGGRRQGPAQRPAGGRAGPDAPRAAAAEPGAPAANAPRQERRSGPARRAARARSGGGRGSGVGVDACRRRACIAPERHGTRHLDRPRRPRRRDLILTPWYPLPTDPRQAPRLPGPGLQDTQAARRTPPRRLPATWGGPSDPTARALRGG